MGKFRPGWNFFWPLAAHAGVHAAATFFIVQPWTTLSHALGLAAFDFAAHFIMDRIKASPRYLGRWKALSASEYVITTAKLMKAQYSRYCGPGGEDWQKEDMAGPLKRLRHNTLFWWSMGFDQAIHHLTHYFIIWMLVS